MISKRSSAARAQPRVCATEPRMWKNWPTLSALRGAGDGVELCERRTHEARGRGQVSRQAQRAHAQAVGLQGKPLREAVARRFPSELHVVVEVEHLIVERRLVGQHAHRIFVDFQPLAHGFHHDGAGLVGDQPMQRRERQSRAEGDVHQIDAREQLSRLRKVRALAEQPGDEFKGRDVVGAVLLRAVKRAGGKVQARHAQAFFVGGVVVERVVFHDERHADHRVMLFERRGAAKGERESARRDRNGLVVGVVEVEVPAEIVIAGSVGDRRTHGLASHRLCCFHYTASAEKCNPRRAGKAHAFAPCDHHSIVA